MAQHPAEPESDRAVLVGTHQALGNIRKKALRPDFDGSANCAVLLASIRESFGVVVVVVDEGHCEPAVFWSRAVRAFNLPILLLSATPYRNDYTSFRVRGRYLFNYPYARPVFPCLPTLQILLVSVGDLLHLSSNRRENGAFGASIYVRVGNAEELCERLIKDGQAFPYQTAARHQ